MTLRRFARCTTPAQGLTVLLWASLLAATAAPPVLAQGYVDFGVNTSRWAFDGECDDPRFVGPGAADVLVAEDFMADAADCEAAFRIGSIWLQDEGMPIKMPMAPQPGFIDFGVNSSRWAFDGECDDPRFAGPGAAAVLAPENIMADAADCEAAFRMGSVWVQEQVPGLIGMPRVPKAPPGFGAAPQGPGAEPPIQGPAQHPAEPPAVPMDWPAWVPATTELNTPASSTAMEPQEVFAAVEGSIYLVLAAATPEALVAGEGSLGSAVAISKHLALTNCHVVEDAPFMTLVDQASGEETEIEIELISADPETDRCILRADAWLRPIRAIRPASSLTVGERVYSIGNPSGLSKTFAEGLISGVREDEGVTLVQTSAPISPGSSGGALVDASGALVGITTFLLRDTQNLNFAISASAFWE
jgi:hypothetical protein